MRAPEHERLPVAEEAEAETEARLGRNRRASFLPPSHEPRPTAPAPACIYLLVLGKSKVE